MRLRLHPDNTWTYEEEWTEDQDDFVILEDDGLRDEYDTPMCVLDYCDKFRNIVECPFNHP